ncbi:uncharacterized protein LOC127103342 [Lathyrus oleraceus]|uniref:uncharacterized protein LOC127103342 n=1 Tax=Pisum sativum TaxID=3888 RepID=UPI0021CE6FD1|nr:uncharacterized protein LOC127103342 [Pisum sativum]
MDKFFRISQCQSVKEIWDTLVETHEGTVEVKRSRLNTLSQEYEMFRMLPGESLVELQKIFLHLMNHLIALKNTFTNDDLNLKVLRSLIREWKTKVTAISEKKSLSTMTSTSLFEKLQEHGLELGILEQHENQEKKSKGIVLKVESKEERTNDDPEEDENFMLLVKRLSEKESFKKKEASTSTQDVTCYECGKQGPIKPDCPKLSKKGGFKGKKEFKNKKVYVALEDNEISSSSESEIYECANIALMTSHHFDDEEDEVSNNFSLYNSDAQGAKNELLEECKILYKTISSQKKQISSIEEKVLIMEKDVNDEKQRMISEKQNFVCKNCESLSFQIVQLKRVLERYEKRQVGLEDVLSHQRYSNDKSGLGMLKTTSNLWYLDSGCSKHMTGNINKFSNLALKAKGYVTYGDKNKGKILGIGKVGAPPFTSIEYNLLKKIFSKGINDNQTEHHEEPIQQESNDTDLPKEWRTHIDHPIDKVTGDISQGIATRLNIKDACLNMAFVS